MTENKLRIRQANEYALRVECSCGYSTIITSHAFSQDGHSPVTTPHLRDGAVLPTPPHSMHPRAIHRRPLVRGLGAREGTAAR